MEIKSLRNISFEKIYKSFSNAFENYEIQLNKDQLKTMLNRRGFNPELSFAAFKGENIVAFTFNGVGLFNGKKTAYDTGTGTVKEFRGKGLATEIFKYSIPFLRNVNVEQYLLEVLQHNLKAVSVYKNLGFETSRELNYFVQKNEEVHLKNSNSDYLYVVRRTELSICESMAGFCDFSPSWQNSFDAIERKPDDFIMLGAFIENKPAGYCIFEPGSGDVTQIAVDKQHRRKGVATLLLGEALKLNRYNSVKIINAQANCNAVTEFLKSNNIPVKGRQFEMILPLSA